MKSVSPRLDTLPPAQRVLWTQLSAVGPDFVLYGGTALSLQVGGRISVDFDFFTPNPLGIDQLAKNLPFLREATLQQRASDTATFIVGKGPDSVALSFFGNLRFGRVGEPVQFSDNGVSAAGLLDLAAQKMKVVQQRAEAKDYEDIYTLLSEGISLEEALGASCALYPHFNPAITLKALSYFVDVGPLSQIIQNGLQMAASRVRDVATMSKIHESLLPAPGLESPAREVGDSPEPNPLPRVKERELEI